MMCISRAPLEKLLAYRERMGWQFNWASSHDSESTSTSGARYRERRRSAFLEDGTPPPVTEFASSVGPTRLATSLEGAGPDHASSLADGQVYMTYSSTARGLEPVMVYYGLLDRGAPTAATGIRPTRPGSGATTSRGQLAR